jgi:hypothetical protein
LPRRAGCLAAATLVSTSLIATARADVAPPSKVLSLWETSASGNNISRDCGFSVRVPGSSNQSLWLFCDSSWSGTSSGFWLGATAAIGPYTAGQVPTGLTEIPTPPAAIGAPSNRPPYGFLPVPTGVKMPDGSECSIPGTAYEASWISGAARQPSTADTSKVLITYEDVCAYGDIPAQRFGLVEYAPSSNTLSGQTAVFQNTTVIPNQQRLGSPVFSGGYLYLIGYSCDAKDSVGTCTSGRVFLARVSATSSAWRNADNYRWWNGTDWTRDYNAAVSILPGARPLYAHMEDFGSLGRGWTVTRTGTAPCGGQVGLNLCRAYFGHPELSTSSNLLMSYYDPTNDHVSVMAVPW